MEWGGVLTFCPRRTSKYVTNLQLRCWLFYITCNYFVICYLSNCHYVVGSSNITCNYVVIFFFKLQLRCWLFEHHLQLRCYLLSFPQHEIIKKNTMELPRKKPKENWSVPKLTFDAPCIKEVFHKCQRRLRGFRSSGMFKFLQFNCVLSMRRFLLRCRCFSTS